MIAEFIGKKVNFVDYSLSENGFMCNFATNRKGL